MERGVLWSVVVCVAVAGSAWGNLLANPGFETGDLTGWDWSSQGDSVSIRDASWRPDIGLAPHSGSYFAVAYAQGADLNNDIWQNFPAPDGPGYYEITLSYWGWMYDDSSEGENTLRSEFAVGGMSVTPLQVNCPTEPQQSWHYCEASWVGPVGVPPNPSTGTTLKLNLTPKPDANPWWETGEAFVAIDDVTVTAKFIPEPTTITLLGIGLLGLRCHRIRARG